MNSFSNTLNYPPELLMSAAAAYSPYVSKRTATRSSTYSASLAQAIQTEMAHRCGCRLEESNKAGSSQMAATTSRWPERNANRSNTPKNHLAQSIQKQCEYL